MAGRRSGRDFLAVCADCRAPIAPHDPRVIERGVYICQTCAYARELPAARLTTAAKPAAQERPVQLTLDGDDARQQPRRLRSV